MRVWRIKNRKNIRISFNKWYERKKGNTDLLGTSGIGRHYEMIANFILDGSVRSKNFHHPYDLEWNGLKIDVKMRNKNSKGKYFFSSKPKCTADYFLCFCVEKTIKFILLIPKNVYGKFFTIDDEKIQTIYKKYILEIKEQ